VVVIVCTAVQKCGQERGVWAKYPKPSSGARLQVCWWKQTVRVVEGVVGVWKMRWPWYCGWPFENASGGGGFGPKCETEAQWLDFGYSMSNGGEEGCDVVVGWLVRCDGGREAACSKTRWVWAKNEEPSRSGSVSGLPSETAVEGDAGRF